MAEKEAKVLLINAIEEFLLAYKNSKDPDFNPIRDILTGVKTWLESLGD